MASASNSYEIQLIVSKYVFGPNENVSITGYLRNISSNSTENSTILVNGANVNITLMNSTNGTVNTYLFATNENGTFFSRSSFNPSATAILSPNATGTYRIVANYTEGNGSTASSDIVVVNIHIDDIIFQLPKVNFYSSESMTIIAKAVQKVGDSFAAVPNVTFNITMRYTNESIINTYNCVTGTSGTCTINSTAPSAAGTYILEANKFVGFTNFNVVPFDIEAYMKDSSALIFKNVFARGESGFVEVRVSYNSTTPSGTYNATGDVIDTSSNNVINLSSVILNSTNGFVDKLPFTAVSSLRVGFYTARIYVTKDSGDIVNTTTNFQVRDWSLTFGKASSKDSGFEYGYTVFVNATVFLEAYPVERSNGTVIENLTSNFTISLKNGLGTIVGNATVNYNATCGTKACYEFNITMPNIIGDYSLSVAANYSGDYQTVDRTLKVTDITASAQPTDSEGALKELFGTTEFVYISLTAKNKTSSMNASDVEVSSVVYENGTKLSYSQGNISNMNLSDSALQWVWNSSSRRLVIDPPKRGGIYLMEIYVNNRSSVVTTRFGINPYDVCASAKGSADTSTSDYWYQFRTSDIIYFNLKINEAQNTAGRTLSGSNLSGFSSVYGRSSACSFDSTKKRAVNNATVTIEKVVNTLSGHTEPLNASASTCSSVDNTGGYICTVQAASGVWDGGQHAVIFNIQGDDQQTNHRATGQFEARAFYIYGYSSSWTNKITSNITLNLNVYEAGSGWWNSGNGLSGTAVVDSINYHGGVGEWIWPPIKYDYNVTGLNITITNGVASVSLDANRTPTGRWASAYYSAVIKATVNNQVDYGEAWFSIRSWDAYATPVEVRGTSFDTKNSIGPKENVSLYVRIVDAGNYNDYGGGNVLGSVKIKVKKITDYSQSPPAELTSSNFTAPEITVNATSPWYTSANVATYGRYLLNISPASGRWNSGYYSVLIDLNGTESGYGWFNVVSFYAATQPTNANGSGYVYNNKGNTPVYFNVTTTKSQKSLYTASDFVNTTITDVVVRMWDQTTQTQREFKYPNNINVTPLLVNGSQIVNISYFGGTWPSGWYYGEINMRDSENSTSKGWIWFSVQPFRVSASTSNYNVGTKENATVNINVNEPDWNNNALLNGNYTITSVEETSWSGGSYRITKLNYTYNSTAGIFRNSTTLTINPPAGKWKPGYKSGTITVRDNITNATQTAWYSFRATSFTDVVTRTSNVNSGTGSNVTVNITLTSPNGGATYGNLSAVYYWGSFGKTKYKFVIGNCSSISGTCLINSSAIVTIVPPSSGWNEGYNYLYFDYVESDDASAVVESYSNIYFYVKQTLSGYMYAVDDLSNTRYSFGQTENITMFVYSLQNLTYDFITVNVTNAQVARTSSNCWSESCRDYQNVTFEIVNLTNGKFVNVRKTNMMSSGYIRLNASGGTWDIGDYAVKIFVKDTTTGETGVIKDATFRIVDKTPATIMITSPAADQVLNATTILFTATTNKQVVCYVNIYDYGTFNRYYCGTNGTGNSTSAIGTPTNCNITKYNNATSYYFSYVSKWYSDRGGVIYTDSTSHSYNHSTAGMAPQQNYTAVFTCYDTDYNYATNATVFNLIGTGLNTNTTGSGSKLAISIASPANATYNSTTITLNYSVVNVTALSTCWFELNSNANSTLNNCVNTTFTAANGTNRIKVFANNSVGTIFNSSSVFFTVNASDNATLTITVLSPANTTYTNQNVTINYTISGTASACWYMLNGNTTNLTLPNCGNNSLTAAVGSNNITIYANNTNGTVYNLSMTFFTFLNTSALVITTSLPVNTTYASTTVLLNFSVVGTPSVCWYRLNGNTTNITLANCANTTFTAVVGSNNITIYANNTSNTLFNSSQIFFTVDTTVLTLNITFPVNNTAYTTANLSLNYSIIWTPSVCWHKLNNNPNTSITSCANTTILAAEGTNSITVYANNSGGTVSGSSTVNFSVDTTGPNITFVSPTPANGSTINASYVFINITLNEPPDFIRFEFNGTNFTMTNSSTTSLLWFRNHTNLTVGNFTYKVYANDSVGNVNVTAPRTLIVNGTG